jgi:hypothetical protein
MTELTPEIIELILEELHLAFNDTGEPAIGNEWMLRELCQIALASRDGGYAQAHGHLPHAKVCECEECKPDAPLSQGELLVRDRNIDAVDALIAERDDWSNRYEGEVALADEWRDKYTALEKERDELKRELEFARMANDDLLGFRISATDELKERNKIQANLIASWRAEAEARRSENEGFREALVAKRAENERLTEANARLASEAACQRLESERLKARLYPNDCPPADQERDHLAVQCRELFTENAKLREALEFFFALDPEKTSSWLYSSYKAE